jgi:hypothetical protein
MAGFFLQQEQQHQLEIVRAELAAAPPAIAVAVEAIPAAKEAPRTTALAMAANGMTRPVRRGRKGKRGRQVGQHVMAKLVNKWMMTHDRESYYRKTYLKIYIVSKNVKTILAGRDRESGPILMA